jgi:Tfp pilus assembly protein PilF
MDRVEKLKEFLQKSPQDSFLRHALALEYVKLGDDKSARNEFESLLSNEPGYVGSYYHLGKLLEKNGAIEEAIQTYQTGMEQAKGAGDLHAYGELRGAYEELTF